MSTHEAKLPSFRNPPLIETVLGVQFTPIPKLTGGHIGWYWKSVLGESWASAVEVPYLPDQFERFGQNRDWNFPPLQLTVSLPNRLQIIHRDDDRVIQVQNTRFLLNWRKRAKEYPRYELLYSQFIQSYHEFGAFLKSAQLGEPIPNQWEVTYINHIPKSTLWDSPADWHRVLPGLAPLFPSTDGVLPESLAVDLHYELVPQRGRLHVSCKHGRLQEDPGELLVLELTARGPVHAADPQDFERGFELGHQSIVRAFVALASKGALEFWGMECS